MCNGYDYGCCPNQETCVTVMTMVLDKIKKHVLRTVVTMILDLIKNHVLTFSINHTLLQELM